VPARGSVSGPLSWYAGRQVVVSGCSSGIGAATAETLSAAGARVVGLDRSPPTSGMSEFIQVDVGDPDSVDAAAARLSGPIWALFNCAGVSRGAADPRLILRINFLGLRALVEAMLDRMPPGGAIASTSSVAGRAWRANAQAVIGLVRTAGFGEGLEWAERNAAFMQEHGGYETSKEAVILYTRDRCLELGRRGLRINAVAPGVTDTPMLLDVAKVRGPQFLEAVPEPLGRRATAQEQANLLIFLNSDWASYVNGHTLWSDGGALAASELPADRGPTRSQ
jgi:NAD(P)-dependent dehydrogenase (short-subunit alcohol dehydrogenase family)